MLVIVDYGVGNVGSIKNMLKRIGSESIISSNIEEIKKADKIILPGVGSFDNGMEQLKKFNLIDTLTEKVINQKTPILGICLGMQLFTQKSEEGELPGLGFIDAETVRFKINLRIPHMGWNLIDIKEESLIYKEMSKESRFYFAHSYHVVCHNQSDILTTTMYGYEFISSFQKDNIIGVQFHPEKSHKFGMKLFKNFVGNH